MNESELAELWDLFCKNEESTYKLRTLYLDIAFTKELTNVEKRKISDIFKTAEGGTPSRFKKEYWEGDIPWLVSGELKDRVIYSSREKITREGLNSSSTKLFPKDTSLIAITGATTGDTGLLASEFCTNQSIVGIYPHRNYYPKFVWYFLMSKYKYFRKLTSGSAQPHINKGKIDNTDFPLASEEVQERIINKIETFFQLLAKYRPLINDVNKSHDRLLEACFNSLMSPNSRGIILESWNLVNTHFEELISELKDVKILKKTILHFAISGKLVSQDPKDEPASELLKEIKTKKEKLIREKKIQEEKELPQISKKDIPFELPNGWEWTQLGEICYGITSGSTPSKDQFCTEGGIPYLKVYNIVNNRIDFNNKPQFIRETIHRTKNKRSILYPGDVIMNIVGPPLGKIAIIPDDNPEWNCNQAIVYFRPLIGGLNDWIYTFLCEGSFLNSIELIGTAGQDNISITKSKKIVIPIPPLLEQKRIIQKIDELMKTCNELEQEVKENQKNSEHLMEAVLDETFAS